MRWARGRHRKPASAKLKHQYREHNTNIPGRRDFAALKHFNAHLLHINGETRAFMSLRKLWSAENLEIAAYKALARNLVNKLLMYSLMRIEWALQGATKSSIKRAKMKRASIEAICEHHQAARIVALCITLILNRKTSIDIDSHFNRELQSITIMPEAKSASG